MSDYWRDYPDRYDKCPRCNGTGRMTCPTCGGKGRRYTTHYGTGALIGGAEGPCILCSATGRSFCYQCRGSGSVKKKVPSAAR